MMKTIPHHMHILQKHVRRFYSLSLQDFNVASRVSEKTTYVHHKYDISCARLTCGVYGMRSRESSLAP